MRLTNRLKRRAYRMLGIGRPGLPVDANWASAMVEGPLGRLPLENLCVTACGLPRRTPGLGLIEARNGLPVAPGARQRFDGASFDPTPCDGGSC